MSDDSPVGRSYDEREVASILKRAVELQEGAGEAHRLSLAEVQQIAREVGIDAGSVTRAAAALDKRALGGSRSLLGAPTRLHTTVELERQLSDAEVGELLDIVRSTLRMQGETSGGLDTVEWKGKDALGTFQLSISRRSGRTRVHLGTQREEEAALVGTVTGVTGFLGLIAGGVALGGVAPLLGWMLAGGGAAGTFGAMRLLWQRTVRRRDEQLQDLAARVKAAASGFEEADPA